MLPILIVDDDAGACWALAQALEGAGHRVITTSSAAGALRACRVSRPALVITDVRMPGGSGLDLLGELRRDFPGLPVVVATAYGSVDVASTALGRGAADVLAKPLDLERTLATVARLLGQSAVALAAAPGPQEEETLIGSSAVMQEVFRRIAVAAHNRLPLLISGPTGSGKRLAALQVHRHGPDAAAPLTVIDCVTADGSLPAGAAAVVFDGIADLSAAAQAALVRALDEQRGNGPRIIALGADPADGRLRPDLRHRIAVLTLAMPALSERRADLPDLVAHLLQRLANRERRSLGLTAAALAVLAAHDWPGNVRELGHALDEAAALARGGVIDAEHLRFSSSAGAGGPDLATAVEAHLDQHPGEAHQRWMDGCEAPLLAAALARTRGNLLRAAELLGMHRATLRKRARELGLVAARDVAEDEPRG